ncbi:MAG TPA: DNA-3-methyladenine glycosylase I [Thermoanaerobaculia bacterium]
MSFSYGDVAPGHALHGPYHDREYGFPVRSEKALFERLALEINQAGLSWSTILSKREAFRCAFDGFDPEVVARYGALERRRLLRDRGIIRNRMKIGAVIANAKAIVAMRETHRSFAGWLDAHYPRSPDRWRRLFRETFRFTVGEIVREFLLSTGYLPGAHRASCPVTKRIARATGNSRSRPSPPGRSRQTGRT